MNTHEHKIADSGQSTAGTGTGCEPVLPGDSQADGFKLEEFCTKCGRALDACEGTQRAAVGAVDLLAERKARVNVFLEEVRAEYSRARMLHPGMHSTHEGYAVLAEEVEELWELVRRRREDRTADEMRDECVQIAAMALAFASEICDPEIP